MTKPLNPISWQPSSTGSRGSLRRHVNYTVLIGAPLLTLLTIFAIGLVVAKRIVIEPGVRFALPATEFTYGAAGSARAALVSLGGGSPSLLFFDGVRYRISDEAEREGLRAAIARAMDEGHGDTLTLYADAGIPHGDVMRFIEVARHAGLRSVNVAIREAR